MFRLTAVTRVLLLLGLFSLSTHCFSQQDEIQNKRKVVSRVAPEYPRLARAVNLRGIVKVEALVSSGGTVKNVNVKGGHPLLAQAAVDAVRQWKWEPAAHESTESVELQLEP
jgi:TonB family protein